MPIDAGDLSRDDERVKEIRARCAELLRRAVLTPAALLEVERRFLDTELKSRLPEPLRRISAGDYPRAPRTRRFQPTPVDNSRFLDVLAWLTWFG